MFKGSEVKAPGPWPFCPARGTVYRLVLLLPSSTPLYVTMANPSVVLCRAKVPQGVRAPWEQSTAGQKTPGQPGGAACLLTLFTVGPLGKGWDAGEKSRESEWAFRVR